MPTRAYINMLLLVVLAVRSLLPAGYMLQASEASGGSLQIVICTSAGLKLMTVGKDGTSVPAPDTQHVEQGVCPFAAAGAAALAAAEPQSLVREAEYAAITYTMAAALFAETPKPGATSARGPPSALV